MVEVLNVTEKIDKNGKKYKYLSLYSPEHKAKILRKDKALLLTIPSKSCGYVAYEVNYSLGQYSDPGFKLKKGDKVQGRIVNKKVIPYLANSTMITTCTVPVFCSEEDPIDFEIAMEKAFIRAGKTLAKGELKFGESQMTLNNVIPTQIKIPLGCLVVNEL